MTSASLLLRFTPLLRHRLVGDGIYRARPTAAGISQLLRGRRLWCSVSESSRLSDDDSEGEKTAGELTVTELPRVDRWNDPDYRKWKDVDDEISRDIEPILCLAKEILHSDKYLDGEPLLYEDEKVVVEKLLAYHPHSEDKIGCGVDFIMVNTHPQFKRSRCLFVVRTDGLWIDFSYQKCLRAYIREKYPAHAERFIREHLKRGSS